MEATVAGPARRVESLKGVNMSFRRAAIGGLRFDSRLLGSGAQVANEMMFCFAVARAGWQIVYDPEILVHHHPAIRHEVDQRIGILYDAQHDAQHNLTLCYLEYKSWHRAWRSILWRLATGSRKAPGIGAALYHGLRGAPGMATGLKAHFAADWQAVKAWRKTRAGRKSAERNAAPRRA